MLPVEDERPVREMAARILERHGYRVVATRHGADALLAPGEQRGRFDVVVTDLHMPALGGHALMQRLRAEHPDLAFVVMSGHAADTDDRTRVADAADGGRGRGHLLRRGVGSVVVIPGTVLLCLPHFRVARTAASTLIVSSEGAAACRARAAA